MASIVDICNMGLGNIHAASINSLNEASVEAQNCKLRFDYVRDFVLRDAPWNFARSEVGLALLAHEPRQWKYAYRYPSDCVNARFIPTTLISTDDTAGVAYRHRSEFDDPIVTPDPEIPFELGLIEGDKVIMTDEPDAYLIYTARVEDPNLWPADFILMFSHYLGSQVAVPVVGGERSRGMRDDELTQYGILRNMALASNGNERHRVDNRESDFVNVRR